MCPLEVGLTIRFPRWMCRSLESAARRNARSVAEEIRGILTRDYRSRLEGFVASGEDWRFVFAAWIENRNDQIWLGDTLMSAREFLEVVTQSKLPLTTEQCEMLGVERGSTFGEGAMAVLSRMDEEDEGDHQRMTRS